MWLQLMVVPPPLYVGDGPSISDDKVKSLEVQRRVQRSQRSISEMPVKGDF